MNTLDAKGLNCPMPVIMAKKQLDSGVNHFAIVVDNKIAVENLKRLAESHGACASITENNGLFNVEILRGETSLTAHAAPADLMTPVNASDVLDSWVLFVGRDVLGEGDTALGSSLIKMFFYTLLQSDNLPKKILLVNNGVKLATIDEQVAEHLKAIQSKGTEILVCGACLNFYSLSEQLKVGVVSNMYDILSAMQSFSKVITL